MQIDLEFLFRASPTILYKFLTTPSTLIRWFCDDVDIQGDTYTFVWSGSEEVAELVDDIEDERVRFVWDEADENEYLEFCLGKSPVTGETILSITEWCDSDEVEDQKHYWTKLMDDLRKETGG